MLSQDVEQPLIHEWLTAEDAEEAVARLARLADEPVQLLRLNLLLFCADVHPTALTAEVAGIEHGDVQEWRKVLALLQPFLEPLHTPHPAPAEVVGKLPEQTLIRLEQNPLGHPEVHARTIVRE